ncbi:GNAT family N-acetyltransferase [Glutamicibacter sp. MNS18]|uniref:GNAT family N-acetyltransferase n=1 Tax=Glutamicibacter sp. MNS18 TaxID=2989817 RepID=UPI0022364E35|nr:GNAT family N-acetyltransferase [Glutamicibacter sp. MNS18]MCW4464586.1 GNAT family N-acetyltransferase [Glutamicibacter sp. MNS18]
MGALVPWLAGPPHAQVLAELQFAFNTEFDSPCPDRRLLQSRLSRMLAGNQCFGVAIGAQADPAGMGIITLRPTIYSDGPLGVLDELYIKPVKRGTGLGTALLRLAISELLARGGEEMHINVDEEDIDTRRFYVRHGFRNSEPGSDQRMLLYIQDFPRSG